MERYSALQLSRTTGRLPALSGLCMRIAHLRGNDVAGLWLDSLWFDLMWRVEVLHPGSGSSRPSGHRGPSWSWTSVESPVKYWHDITSLSLGPPPDHLIDTTTLSFVPTVGALEVRTLKRRPRPLINYKTQLSGKNPLGEVLEAVITIESYSRKATVQNVYDSEPGSAAFAVHPLRYNLALENVTVPLFADYGLQSHDDQRQINNSTEITLLLIHPRVALVVIPYMNPGKGHIAGEGRENSRMKRYLSKLVMQMTSKRELWQRIGIARVSDTLLDLYQTDWMKKAEISQFTCCYRGST
jgi:hypothetical protein